jgi:hypothetical protein
MHLRSIAHSLHILGHPYAHLTKQHLYAYRSSPLASKPLDHMFRPQPTLLGVKNLQNPPQLTQKFLQMHKEIHKWSPLLNASTWTTEQIPKNTQI